MDHLKLTNEKLSLDEICELVTSPTCGAMSFFVGTTRDNFEGKQVIKLEYEAYHTMALKSMKELCLNLRQKFPNLNNIAIYHRLGVVPVKEASVIIATASPHRKDAIEATEMCIEMLKKNVPIWKKEVYEGAQSEWKENQELSHPPKRKLFKLTYEQNVKSPQIPGHLIQIKASNDEINERIEKFMERKREEINLSNIRDFCRRDTTKLDDVKESCARIDSILLKRKDSKGHLQVNRVLNNYSRDQDNTDYLLKHVPKDGVEERLKNIEVQLSLNIATPKNIYTRLKQLEDRLLYLESISPEYVQFWNKTQLQKHQKPIKKKTFSVMDIDNLISELKNQR